ncbi:hypothetical protein METBIDRAFT_41438 [Metschnikowia bicuspidata var. bicuspidata NRRL YB-4993]|uniref:Something about silencing protein 4 domain-containing protein n=1 Tax=Metschnikowia bicuspidata var. bicuspidata NRRL YB-4993 TaxID=869754 RepID=A0A1A0HCB6_9ASCO|nr:hypothetical protein METBIDRAFT_41438 [Metschnikowia bicuspidata var. bicuspidata NRRL YB-4993]OBA21635.1 hypothetical protein METBIDRAFT_41438 [Metschnikowia bicuspidata var. bicuspidata NRRL YB-4993]
MPAPNEKRRKLRLSDEQTKNTALLYNFDNLNRLLYGDGRICIDRDSPATGENQYKYFGEASWAFNKVVMPKLGVRQRQSELPRRRRRNHDPLEDHVYEIFHKRMKKDERSRTLTDRGRMYFEMDNVKSQLELLLQHDWNKHLPQLTVIKDRSDVDELLAKRQATIRELERTLAKFANWESRTASLAAEIKSYEGHPAQGKNFQDDDADDDDESILDKPLEQLAKQRQQSRLAKHGRPFSILLGNGHKIRYNPYLTPTVAIESYLE